MPSILQKTLNLLLKRQTNILSAAFVVMGTIALSQVLGLIVKRLLVTTFGLTRVLDIYNQSVRVPDFVFQLLIAGALSSAFIPVFSEYLAKGRQEEARAITTTLMILGVGTFSLFAIGFFLFPQQISHVIAPGYSGSELVLMGQMIQIFVFVQLLFIIGSFLTGILQSYSHFFIPGFAIALYNFGIIVGIVFLSPMIGIFGPVYGCVIGASLYVLLQLFMIRRIRFSLKLSFHIGHEGVKEVLRLMWPRTLSIGVYQIGGLVIVQLSSFLVGGSYTAFDYAQSLALAPVSLFGYTIAQAALPVLSRERGKMDEFRHTFLSSITQVAYLIFPVSAILLVLRIPVVRIILGGVGHFTWQDTVLVAQTLAIFTIATVAQAFIVLILRAFYALHDTRTTFIVEMLSTALMIALGIYFVFIQKHGVESLALAYSLASLFNMILLLFLLDRKVGGINKELVTPLLKIISATIFTGFALYIPIKLLDQLVIDTTYTVNLLVLTGISSLAGISLYLFLTWLFNVKEATTFLLMFQKIGNWREILQKSNEVIDPNVIK